MEIVDRMGITITIALLQRVNHADVIVIWLIIVIQLAMFTDGGEFDGVSQWRCFFRMKVFGSVLNKGVF